MRLIEFQIQNYRSIEDSGPITVSRLTALLGRNESGKSNLLHALQTLNPVEGFGALDKGKNFPRHYDPEKCEDSTPVVKSKWELSESEGIYLGRILSFRKRDTEVTRGTRITEVTIDRCYGEYRIVKFTEIPIPDLPRNLVRTITRRLSSMASYFALQFEDSDILSKIGTLKNSIQESAKYADDIVVWTDIITHMLADLKQLLNGIDGVLATEEYRRFQETEELMVNIASKLKSQKKARLWILKQMPIFVFVEQYPQLSGSQNVSEYLSRKSRSQNTAADRNFAKMCKVAGIQPEKLQTLLGNKKLEDRTHLADRASAVITEKIQNLWKDRPLRVHFIPDSECMNTFISDPNEGNTCDVKINLNDRSRGFQWFFSFYVTFAADTDGGDATNAVLLLDEPGLHLHAKSQRDLLTHLEEDFDNQILYTTHSPFMVPMHNMDIIRTVNISKGNRTIVSNDPSGDSRTLFPLQAALGYDLAQSLFVGGNNLVVEGVTDFWILSSISGYLSENGGIGLDPNITITPAGSASKIPYMVSFLSFENLNVVALFDSEKKAKETRNNIVKNKILQEQNVIFVSEAFKKPAPEEADIEDLLDPKMYERLVMESHVDKLEGIDISPNKKIPRIAKRFEAAFEERGVPFCKTRPLRLLLTKMGISPEDIVTSKVADRFNILHSKINAKFKNINKRKKSVA